MIHGLTAWFNSIISPTEKCVATSQYFHLKKKRALSQSVSPTEECYQAGRRCSGAIIENPHWSFAAHGRCIICTALTTVKTREESLQTQAAGILDTAPYLCPNPPKCTKAGAQLLKPWRAARAPPPRRLTFDMTDVQISQIRPWWALALGRRRVDVWKI